MPQKPEHAVLPSNEDYITPTSVPSKLELAAPSNHSKYASMDGGFSRRMQYRDGPQSRDWDYSHTQADLDSPNQVLESIQSVGSDSSRTTVARQPEPPVPGENIFYV